MLFFISVIVVGKVISYLANIRSRDWEVDRPHWVWKNPNAFFAQQWGILVNGLWTEPVTWKNERVLLIIL